jgi:hypothetical protein
MIFSKCFQNCNPFLNLEILPLKRKPACHWQSYYQQQEQHKKPTDSNLSGEQGQQEQLGCLWPPRHALLPPPPKRHKATPTTPWPIAAIASSSTSAEWTPGVGDDATGLATGVTTNSRGRSGVVGSTDTDKGVCITGTDWGACIRTLGLLVWTVRSKTINSGASPNLRRERLSPSRTSFTLKKKWIVKQTVKLKIKWILHLKVYI